MLQPFSPIAPASIRDAFLLCEGGISSGFYARLNGVVGPDDQCDNAAGSRGRIVGRAISTNGGDTQYQFRDLIAKRT
jgi:hypothetical protein